MDLTNNWQQIKSVKPDLNLKEAFDLPVIWIRSLNFKIID